MSNSAFNRSQVTYPAGIQAICDFRLTLVSGAPVMTTSQTGATTLYMTPYKGSEIALYDGTNWNLRSTTEISISLVGTTASKNYDVWCYDNGGTPTLELLVWTNDSTRATALAYQNGVLVKSGTATRRYLGTIRINSTGGQCNFIFGAIAAGGTAGDFGVWNYYNRVTVVSQVQDNTNSWTQGNTGFRAANTSNTMRTSFIIGVQEDQWSAMYGVLATQSSSDGGPGIGVNSTSVCSGTHSYGQGFGLSACFHSLLPAVGYNYLQALEFNDSGTATWYGDNAGYTGVQSGFIVTGKL